MKCTGSVNEVYWKCTVKPHCWGRPQNWAKVTWIIRGHHISVTGFLHFSVTEISLDCPRVIVIARQLYWSDCTPKVCSIQLSGNDWVTAAESRRRELMRVNVCEERRTTSAFRELMVLRESGSGTETDVYSCHVSQRDEWAEDCWKLLSQCGRMRNGITAEKQKNDYKVHGLADSSGSIVAIDGASFQVWKEAYFEGVGPLRHGSFANAVKPRFSEPRFSHLSITATSQLSSPQ